MSLVVKQGCRMPVMTMRAARMLLVTMMRMMLQFLKLLLHVIAVSVVHDVHHDADRKSVV